MLKFEKLLDDLNNNRLDAGSDILIELSETAATAIENWPETFIETLTQSKQDTMSFLFQTDDLDKLAEELLEKHEYTDD